MSRKDDRKYRPSAWSFTPESERESRRRGAKKKNGMATLTAKLRRNHAAHKGPMRR